MGCLEGDSPSHACAAWGQMGFIARKHTFLLRLVNIWYTTDGKDKRWREEVVMLGLIRLGKDKGGYILCVSVKAKTAVKTG